MKYKVTLNGKTYEVVVEKGEAIVAKEYEAVAPQAPQASVAPIAAPVAQAAPAQTASAGANATVAPLSGTIANVPAKVGQAVKKGTPIVIIEAMKMENEIVAAKDGTITNIFVSKGQAVATGDALFELA